MPDRKDLLSTCARWWRGDVLRDERGATAIEYALIAGLIFLAIVVSVGSTGTGLSARWVGMADTASNHLKTTD
ncbi:Flp family type IVb pilin [Pinisolibacter aquiterrae]|uniref:Flp family type IVb pilin n=1 Tax=Pinisolibacter aquiterrae TaxID=2815579 RepID=UPI001C3CFC70|nr:Flp family type IVb pilin [Pinisolibacter aquiterrae]MBV5262783.1 Flp family type IVb pilin [Pinisolibacter aquiterrae]MCC8233315.1 Flp family type IVb pilin [Pinisolibacter aquiterrae]